MAAATGGYTVATARRRLAEMRPRIDEFVRLRARFTIARAAREAGDDAVALADLKADEARIADLLDGFGRHDVQVKNWAPLLLDFPLRHGDRDLLLCWVEGEAALDWYHDVAHGFAGRRPIVDLGTA